MSREQTKVWSDRPPGEPESSAASAGPTKLVYLDRAAWTRLARPTDDADFLSGWLALQCRSSLQIVAGVVVLGEPDSGQYAPAAFWPERSAPKPDLAKAAHMAIDQRQGIVLRNEGGTGSAVAYPLIVDERLHGLVALELSSVEDIELQVLMRQLQWGIAWLEAWLRRRQAQLDRTAIEQLGIVLKTLSTSLEHDDAPAAALAVVTEMATALDCERVSLGVWRRGAARLMAMSHAATFARNSSIATAIAGAMDEAIDQAATIAFPPDGDEPLLVRAQEALQKSAGVAQVITVPVFDRGSAVAALTFEYRQDASTDERRRELAESLAGLAGSIIARAFEAERALPVKAAHAARTQIVRLFGPNYLGRKMALAAAVLLSLGLSVFAIPFNVAGDARIEGLVQRTVAAPFAGFLSEASVRPGDVVAEAQTLAQLDSREAALERHAWLMRREQHSREHQRVLSEHRLANARVLTAQIDEADAQIRLLDNKIERAQIKAPFKGVVIDGDHSQTLGRALQQGEVLFVLAPLDSYRLVIEVDERDIIHLREGLTGQLILTSLPGTPLSFKVAKLSLVTSAAKGRNTYRVEARLEGADAALRPGMEGIAKIRAGNELAIWVWTRRMIDWARLQLWTWWP